MSRADPRGASSRTPRWAGPGAPRARVDGPGSAAGANVAAAATTAVAATAGLTPPMLGAEDARQDEPPTISNILLVDDHPENLLALEAVLEPLGQRLVCARSGEEALRHLLHEEFSVILLDVRMPGMDGFETARYINARQRTRHTPIIFLTGHDADTEQVFRGYEAGAVDYVLKPFEPAVMRSKVLVFVRLYQERVERIWEAQGRAQAEAVATTVRKLQSLSDAALAHLEMAELLPELLERTAALFDAATAGVMLADEAAERMALRATYGLEALPRDCTVGAGEGFLGGMLNASEAAALPKVSDDSGLHSSLAATGVRSLLAAPLVAGGKRLGVLYLGSRRSEHFSDEDAVLMGLGSERAAIALDHARSYERERRLVEMLQRSLLPERLPELRELEMAARYRPSGSAAKVGGDWYDAIVLPDGLVGLVIGDVVGHGVRAATVMGELRNALRAYALEGASPGRAVGKLSAFVESVHGEGMAATLTFATLDLHSGQGCLANAGHLPALLVPPEGEPRYLSHHAGLPVGVGGFPQGRPEHDFALAAGSALLLFTDGLVERREHSIDDGLEQLRRAVSEGPSNLEDLCAHVLERLLDDRAPSDDVALLAVRLRPADDNLLALRLPAETSSVPIARHAVARLLEKQVEAADTVFDLKLAVSEAVANAVEHAYGPGDHMLEVTAHVRDQGVEVTVSDTGHWRTPRGSARGRGLKLIAALIDDLDVQCTDEGTAVHMFKRLALAPSGSTGA